MAKQHVQRVVCRKPKFATAPLSLAHIVYIEKKQIASICDVDKYLPNKMSF